MSLDCDSYDTHNSIMRITLLPANEYTRVRWKNGQGWTREILRIPEDRDDWDWRVSIAEVDHGGPFSAFEGCDRELVLLTGDGMRLNFDDGESVELLPPHGRQRFSGERTLSAELISGPTQDFNLIWRRDRIAAQLLHRPLVGPMVFFAEAGVTWLIYLLAGQAQFKDQAQVPALQAGDSALLQPLEGGVRRLILDGGGEVLLARIETHVDQRSSRVHTTSSSTLTGNFAVGR